MGTLGVRAMAVGYRDLSAGAGFVAEAAKKAGVLPLSCNLVRGGKPVFEGSTVVTTRGVKVALVGVTAAGTYPPAQGGGAPVPGTVEALAPVPAIQRELARLGPHDVTVLLAAVGYRESLSLAEALGAQVDFIVQSGELRGITTPQPVGGTVVLASGQRGQHLGRLELDVDGRGAWHDLEQSAREEQQLQFLEVQVSTLEDRLKKAQDPAGKRDLAATLGQLKQRRAEQAKVATAARVPGARAYRLSWKVLDQSVVDEPALKAKVLEIEPTYAGSH